MKQYHIYIMTNTSRTLYVGVTNNLERRVWQHKQKLADGFTKRYNITILACYEATDSIEAAITREKQLKRLLRSKKIAIVESMNPQWLDLSAGWYQ